MKLKRFISVFVTLFTLTTALADGGGPIIINPVPSQGSGQGMPNKAPVQTPTASIEDYTLTFDASCIGCMIEVVQDGEVVYTTYVDSCGEVELPSTLSGTLQLFIYRGGITFTGEFEL